MSTLCFPFKPMKVPRLEDNVIAWHSHFGLAVVGKIVVLGENSVGSRTCFPGKSVNLDRGIPRRVPGPSRGQAWLSARVCENLGRITQLFDLLDDSPFEPIQVIGKPRMRAS
jgi:hypothetical protein